MQRTLWSAPTLGDYDHDGQEEVRIQVSNPREGNLQSSLLEDGQHAPTLDIDMPCELRPSSTEGHFHLLIDCPMSWRKYRRLLKALAKAGVIERNYYKHARRRHATFVRLPHARKRSAS